MSISRLLVLSLAFAVAQAQFYFQPIPCREADQCLGILGPGRHYMCNEGYCFCPNHASGRYELCSNQNVMVGAMRPTGLRRNCTTQQDCEAVNGAHCQEGKDKWNKICLCRPDMVESSDGQRCLPIVADLGGVCLEQAQCHSRMGEGAECAKGRCGCRDGHHEAASKRCVRNLGYGDRCIIKEDGCYMTNSPNGENLLYCSLTKGCICKKHWSYSARDHHCVFSGASQVIVQLSTMSALILLIAFF